MSYDQLGLDALKELEGLLWQLATALDAQRRAVSDIDPEALDQAAAAKRSAVEAIERIGAGSDPTDETELADPTRRRAIAAVKAAAEIVRISAQANALLLADAVAVIGQALGTRDPASGYDRRARRIPAPRPTYAKAI
jgi:erythromycin esterase-like protein